MRIKENLQKLISKNSKVRIIVSKIQEHFWFYLICTLLGIYLYGIFINSFIGAMRNFTQGTANETLSLNPIKCFAAVFTPQGLGVLFFLFVMYVLIAGKWIYLITGVKITKDERNFDITNEGTHGTSGWMTKKERDKILVSGTADNLPCPILCKIKNGEFEDDKYAEYVGLRDDCGLNKHQIIYGATGSGKSRGYVKPMILKMVQLMVSGKSKQSMIIVDPKAELFEQYSQHLRDNGYVVKALNLLDMENSDGWNCIGETEGDVDMVQSVAETIIRNTSEEGQKADFWDKAEQNLLIALILYVQSTIEATIDYEKWDSHIVMTLPFFEIARDEERKLFLDIFENSNGFNITATEDGKVRIYILINYFEEIMPSSWDEMTEIADDVMLNMSDEE